MDAAAALFFCHWEEKITGGKCKSIHYMGKYAKAEFRELIKPDFREWSKADSTLTMAFVTPKDYYESSISFRSPIIFSEKRSWKCSLL